MAHAYVLPAARQHFLFTERWQMEWFVEVHLQGYVSRCRLFTEAFLSERTTATPLFPITIAR
jgi:hypothetical protein